MDVHVEYPECKIGDSITVIEHGDKVFTVTSLVGRHTIIMIDKSGVGFATSPRNVVAVK